ARDKSIEAGGCGPETFAAMLDAAIAENPGMTVAARVHPFDGVGGRKGHLKALAQARSVHIYDANVSWMSAAKLAARVYVATSHAGLEALIAGAKVTCFGMPAYAGWGLTDDRIACPRRTARPSLDALIAAIYGRYSHYLSPLDGEPCTALDIARLLAARRRRDAETEGVTHVLGVNRLKRVQIRPFVEGKRSRVTWTMKPDDALAWQRADGGRIVSWASREPVDFHAACKAQGAPHIRLEDGFLRSVGLGANLELPASLVLDDQGIYYDPRTPSGLETLLQTAVFDAETLYRASALRDAIRAARVSKYNVGGGEVAELFANAGKRSKVLVPAQVEADASVLLGGGDIQTNLALLQAVRTARPDAFIVFKPHPDVEAGIRPGAVPRGVALTLADVIAEKAAMPDLLDQVDEVHTLTSLSGFEALLRDVPVIAYGSPFYAGWGLTEDRQNFPHRSRRLSLDELVAGTLLLYPRYTHRPSDWPCEAEDVVRQLQFSLRKKGAEGLIGRRRALTMLRQLMGRPPK
ncbi:MAG: capsular polysaccharide biosynthesis protein, partial [Caulobacteraceae bacterium]